MTITTVSETSKWKYKKRREKEFVNSLDGLFNIVRNDTSTIIKIEEDNLFSQID